MDIFFGKKKHLILYWLSLGLLICVLYYFDFQYSNPIIFWSFIILFIVSFIRIIQLLTNKNLLFVTEKDLKNNSQIENELINQNINSSGNFEYLDIGFRFKKNKSTIEIYWSSIKTIIAYKKDLYIIDTICIDIVYDDNLTLTICEETPGWFQFNNNLKKQFMKIPENWDIEIMTPAFETNLTLLYDLQNRTLKQVIGEMN